jgi:hypothetical protein
VDTWYYCQSVSGGNFGRRLAEFYKLGRSTQGNGNLMWDRRVVNIVFLLGGKK